MYATDKEFHWFIKQAKKDGVVLKTEEDYKQMQRDLYALADLTYDMHQIQKQFDARLEREPEGFVFPADGRICRLCMGGGSGNFWYDKLGMRCIDCQTAYVEKIIPGYVFTDDKNKRHISETTLVVRHGATRKEIRKCIKEGILRPRRIEHGQTTPTLIFLKSENANLTVFS